MMITLLCDILKPVNTLSESLQSSEINFMDVDAKVKACTDQLDALQTQISARNQHQELYMYRLDGILDEITDRTDLLRRQRGNNNAMAPDNFIREKAVSFISSLVGEITDAFACHPVFKAFKVLDPRELPDDQDQLVNHGKEPIETLIRHYATEKADNFKGHIPRCQAVVDSADLLRAEYSGFKHQMYMMRQTYRANNPGRDFGPAELLRNMSDPVLRNCFKRIYTLVELMCIIPTSTAAVERGFSVLNSVCTSERSTLLQSKLSSLLMMNIEGPSELSDQDLEEMCNVFRDAKARRIDL